MRTPIDFLMSAIEKRLAARIAADDGALAQALANRYSACCTGTGSVDPALTARHLSGVQITLRAPFEAWEANPAPSLSTELSRRPDVF
jgi:hypothetical protein